MSVSYRRFELLLPRRFNDGQAVPDELIADTLLELEERFGAVSSETQPIHGLWRHGEQIFRDELIRVFVDTLDVAESRTFFAEFKERVKAQFQQIDIWLVTYPIDVM